MPTVVVRFETCKKAIGYGTVYYRIYKGHNLRMEFSSHLHLPTSSWDETTKTILGRASKSLSLSCSDGSGSSAFEPDYNGRCYWSTDNGRYDSHL